MHTDMNLRYDRKNHPIAPQGRAIQVALKKAHRLLEKTIGNSSTEGGDSLTDSTVIAELIEPTTPLSPAVQRKAKVFESRAKKVLQRRFLQDYDYSFDFGQVVFTPITKDTQFLTLPFDSEWLNGPGKANRYTGELAVGMIGVGDVVFGSGLGLFVSSPNNVIAYVRALMPIDYEWKHILFASGFAGSSGTVGILVYETSSGKIVVDKRATLWNESMWAAAATTRQGSNRIYLTQTKVAEVSFYMSAGKSYQVWFWLNVGLRTVGLSLSSAVIHAKIPLVIMNTGTPPIVK
jgi:hypothetical protein